MTSAMSLTRFHLFSNCRHCRKPVCRNKIKCKNNRIRTLIRIPIRIRNPIPIREHGYENKYDMKLNHWFALGTR